MSEELVEKVAVEVHRVLWPTLLPSARGYPKHTWRKSEELARAAIGVTLDAVRELVEKKAREWDAEAKRDAAFPDDQRVDLAHAEGLREAISGLSIDSLGAEGGNPE